MNTLIATMLIAECLLPHAALTSQIKAEPQIEDVVVYEWENDVLIALLYKPTFFKSQTDGVEKRVRLLAKAYFGKTVYIARDSGTYYKLKNCGENSEKAAKILQTVKDRK